MIFEFKKMCSVILAVLLLAGVKHQNAVAQGMPALAPNLLTLSKDNYHIKFIWKGDSVNNRWEPHAALLLPVKISGCKKQFYMQFDTGSPYTLFYKSQLQQIHDRYAETVVLSDTATSLPQLEFKVGKMPVSATDVKVLEYNAPKINWKDKKSIIIIGTIGTDFIENRVIGINYPVRKFFTGMDIPANWATKGNLTDFMFAGRSVLLPAIIRGKKKLLYFDTGSSAYELLTDKKTTEELATKNAQPIKFSSRSWDKILTANSIATSDSMLIGSTKLPIGFATYIEGSSQSQIDQMMKMGIGGMTGNKLFIHSILLLDTRNKKFAILDK